MELAREIIAQVLEEGVAADGVMREHLRQARPGRAVGAQVAALVYAWFRWCGWFRGPRNPELPLGRALAMAEAFAEAPEAITDRALLDHAVPRWVSRVMEVTPEMLRSLQAEPALWLRARPESGNELRTALGECRPAGRPGLPDAWLYTGEDDLFRTEAFAKGRFEIQHLVSQAVSAVCAPKPGETWWDACAGEGGKTLHLSDLMQNKGLIWASDRSLRRLASLKRRAARAGVFNFRSVPWEGGETPPTKTRFDGVLLDAPCSGLGSWQRYPDARWTTEESEIAELAAIQARLLRTAAASVKPGGRLVYAVCTLTRDETTGVADAFSAGRPEFEPCPFADPFAPDIPPAAQAMWWPQDHGGNGMFVAAWRRRAH